MNENKIKIYNTRTKKKEEFVPCKDGEISMYVCGPTVYDLAHLGHGRSAVAFDVIRKYLKYRYPDREMKYVSNYTDIEDKMINRAKEENVSVADLAARIIPEYERDYGALGIDKADMQPRATETIPEIINIIKILEKKKFTYSIPNDGVYFDVSKFPKYGQLSGQKLEDLKMGTRVDVNENKKHPYDFVLWKFKKEGEPAWASPWGEGRPGWHIECSAMTWKNLGEKFDIHGGGLDLTFPHHECEVAQSKAAFGKDAFAQYWMHNGFIQIDNQKMSKSLGNFFTLKDIFKKYDPQVVRFMFLQTHYRNPINFSDKLLEQAKARLDKLYLNLKPIAVDYENIGSPSIDISSDEKLTGNVYLKHFERYMDNDFNTSGALSCVDDLLNFTLANDREVIAAYNFLKIVGDILGFNFPPKEEDVVSSFVDIANLALPIDVQKLLELRDEARKNKDFKKSDELRDELRKKGYEPMDTAKGTILKKL